MSSNYACPLTERSLAFEKGSGQMLDIADDVLARIKKTFIDNGWQAVRTGRTIPLMVWISRAYSVNHSGQHVEYGPYFSFQWTDDAEMRQYGYFQFSATDGYELAFAPGELFRAKFHSIHQDGDRVILIPCE